MVDRNRRGLIILTEKNDEYEIALKNLSCFSSENEEGGVYYAPELSLESTGNGNLIVSYHHGRYGYWSYTFRWNNNDFELIGYDASENQGPVVNSTRSINFLSGKKQIRTNTNDTAQGDDEVFIEKWEKIKAAPLIKLSEVKDFDELYFE